MGYPASVAYQRGRVNRRVVVVGVAGVVLLMPLACGVPSAPSRTTAPRTTVTTPAAVTITLDRQPFPTRLRGAAT